MRSLKELVDDIRTGTRLKYQKGTSIKQADFIQPLNLDRLEYAVSQRYLGREDYYILEMVYKACFATPEFLFWQAVDSFDRQERAGVEISKAKLLTGLHVFRKRLETLAGLGLMFCYELTVDKVKFQIFYLSMEGFRAFSVALDQRLIYNRSLVYKPVTEVFKFLGANTVTFGFTRNPYCRKARGFEAFELHYGKKTVYEDIYGRVTFQKDEKSPAVHALIEPIYFRFNSRDTSEAEVVQKARRRIQVMRDVAESLQKDGMDAYVIFLVEDGDGAHMLNKLLAETELSFIQDKCFITSENCVNSSLIFKHDGTDSLLGIEVKDGQLVNRRRNLPGAFYPDEEKS